MQMYAIHADSVGRCESCTSRDATVACTGCGLAWYCDDACRTRTTHHSCDTRKELKDDPLPRILGVFRWLVDSRSPHHDGKFQWTLQEWCKADFGRMLCQWLSINPNLDVNASVDGIATAKWCEGNQYCGVHIPTTPVHPVLELCAMACITVDELREASHAVVRGCLHLAVAILNTPGVNLMSRDTFWPGEGENATTLECVARILCATHARHQDYSFDVGWMIVCLMRVTPPWTLTARAHYKHTVLMIILNIHVFVGINGVLDVMEAICGVDGNGMDLNDPTAVLCSAAELLNPHDAKQRKEEMRARHYAAETRLYTICTRVNHYYARLPGVLNEMGSALFGGAANDMLRLVFAYLDQRPSPPRTACSSA